MGVVTRVAGLAAALGLAACGSVPRGASVPAGPSTQLECAPYARRVSGIRLYGAAASWWDGATGRYARSSEPAPGSVLVFRRSGRLPYGHVSVVSRVLGGRLIEVSQANWVHRRIGPADPVQDVSPANDWSAVRVWWQPAGAMGTTTYPTYGFVHPRSPSGRDAYASAGG